MGIIGINGRIGSGKDTVGKIIQYLTITEGKVRLSFDLWIKETSRWYNPYDWQIKKFAGKLKECVSILTGYSLEQLEDPKIKEQVAFMRRQRMDYVTGVPFDDTVQLYESLSVRELLQELGTEVGRSISENLWIDALMKGYQGYQLQFFSGHYSNVCKKCGKQFTADKRQSICEPCSRKVLFPNWVITDMRFPNEMKAVKVREGITIRVNRNDYIFDNDGKRIIPSKSYTNIDTTQHISETALDEAEFDYTIENDGTIEELIEKVREILIKEKLLCK